MSFEDVILLNILSRMYKPEGGGCGCGCLILILAIVIAFILDFAGEHKTTISIIFALIFAFIIIFGFILPKINDILCEIIDRYLYKDETPEKREERLETSKLIREWRKRNYF